MIQIIMGSRVIFGMVEKGASPALFAYIHPRTRTPIVATGFFSAVLIPVTLWFPIEDLAKITSFIILIIFALVTLSLVVIKLRLRHRTSDANYRLPVLIPLIGFLLCILFILVQF
jgi:amino acid transporter